MLRSLPPSKIRYMSSPFGFLPVVWLPTIFTPTTRAVCRFTFSVVGGHPPYEVYHGEFLTVFTHDIDVRQCKRSCFFHFTKRASSSPCFST